MADEVDTGTRSVLEVQLHPLVILNITDHWTKTKVMKGQAMRVVGALLGVQSGRVIEIHTSFELILSAEGADEALDMEYLTLKREHYMQVFPNYDVVGWYTTDTTLADSDTAIHKCIMRYNESPLLVQLDPNPPPESSSLPLWISETVVHVVNDTPKYSFNKVKYVIESEESERISIDNVTHGTGNDSIITPLKVYRGALIMLRRRVAVVKAYLEGVRADRHAKDHEILREIQALCNRLPTQTSKAFTLAYNEEYDDSLLITYLSTLTRTAVSLAELVETHGSLSKRDPALSHWY